MNRKVESFGGRQLCEFWEREPKFNVVDMFATAVLPNENQV
jgi:hypothetical protein